MRRGGIKTAFLAPLLGLAIYVSGPARAATDELLVVCATDPATGDLLATKVHASAVILPAGVVDGVACPLIVQLIKIAGYDQTQVTPFDTFGPAGGIFPRTTLEGGLGLEPGGDLMILWVFTCPVAPCLDERNAGAETEEVVVECREGETGELLISRLFATSDELPAAVVRDGSCVFAIQALNGAGYEAKASALLLSHINPNGVVPLSTKMGPPPLVMVFAFTCPARPCMDGRAAGSE